MNTLKRLLLKARDWLLIFVVAILAFWIGRTIAGKGQTVRTVTVTKEGNAIVPEAKITWKEKLIRVREIIPETVLVYKGIELPVPTERILSLDWDRGRLSFLSDSAKEYKYQLGRGTYAFSIMPRDPGFMVKRKRALWERRCAVGMTYPLGAFARADLSIGRLFLQGEVTTDDWKAGIGWRLF